MKTVKELVWKLDREVWAHVPDGGQSEPWTASKAREESNKLINEFIKTKAKEALHDTLNKLDGIEKLYTRDQMYEIWQSGCNYASSFEHGHRNSADDFKNAIAHI